MFWEVQLVLGVLGVCVFQKGKIARLFIAIVFVLDPAMCHGVVVVMGQDWQGEENPEEDVSGCLASSGLGSGDLSTPAAQGGIRGPGRQGANGRAGRQEGTQGTWERRDHTALQHRGG